MLEAANASELTNALFEVLEELEVVQGVGFIGGNAFSLVPAGDPGVLSVVATGPYNGSTMPILVRKNTNDNVIRVAASAAVRNSASQLIASGGDQGLGPNLVRPGGITFGHLYFGGIELPADAIFDVTLDAKLASDDQFENIRDLEIVEATSLDGRVVGVVQNTYDVTITGPVGVDLICFDEAGVLLTEDTAFLAQDSLTADADATFQVPSFGNRYCPYFLVASSGFDNTFSASRASEALTPVLTTPQSTSAAVTSNSNFTGTEPTPTHEPSTPVALETDACPSDLIAEQVVLALQQRGLPVSELEVYTEETDPNELLGRPGGYTSKVNFRLAGLDQTTGSFDVKSGGSVEVFSSDTSALARSDYIRALYEASPLLSEYDSVQGVVILRLSNQLTPDEAASLGVIFESLGQCEAFTPE